MEEFSGDIARVSNATITTVGCFGSLESLALDFVDQVLYVSRMSNNFEFIFASSVELSQYIGLIKNVIIKDVIITMQAVSRIY